MITIQTQITFEHVSDDIPLEEINDFIQQALHCHKGANWPNYEIIDGMFCTVHKKLTDIIT